MKSTPNCASSANRYEIRIAGAGGQGIIMAGTLLAEAALLSGNYVAQTQSYGAETRGGNSVSDVIISSSEVDYPKATKLDILVALTQESCDQNLLDMKEDGLVIVDSDLVKRVLWERSISIPFNEIAKKNGEERAINVAALASVAQFCPLISRQSLKKAIGNRLRQGKLVANMRAFDEVWFLALNFKDRAKAPGKRKDEYEI